MATARSTDPIDCPALLFFEAYGVNVGLRATDASLSDALRRLVPPGGSVIDPTTVDAMYSLTIGGDEQPHEAFAGDRSIARNHDLDGVLGTLESEMHLRIATEARTRLFVHAGVVGWRGGAILVPGRTHSGKSSLVAALLAQGATYYSDEYAVLDGKGQVHPFARTLNIRDSCGSIRRVDASTLGVSIGEAPLPVRLVIATRYVSGAIWSPAPMSPGETVLALLDNTVAARSRPADALKILGTVATGALGLRGDRGEATHAAGEILAHA